MRKKIVIILCLCMSFTTVGFAATSKHTNTDKRFKDFLSKIMTEYEGDYFVCERDGRNKKIYQISNIKYSIKDIPLTAADKLNKIESRTLITVDDFAMRSTIIERRGKREWGWWTDGGFSDDGSKIKYYLLKKNNDYKMLYGKTYFPENNVIMDSDEIEDYIKLPMNDIIK